MKAKVSINETKALIASAAATYGLGCVAMDIRWRKGLRELAKRELAKAWFPWTKAYWQKGLDDETILWDRNRSFYNSPRYYHWMHNSRDKAVALQSKYATAAEDCQALEIILSDEEITLLNMVSLVQEILSEED